MNTLNIVIEAMAEELSKEGLPTTAADTRKHLAIKPEIIDQLADLDIKRAEQPSGARSRDAA
jgi:hypothetical protein